MSRASLPVLVLLAVTASPATAGAPAAEAPAPAAAEAPRFLLLIRGDDAPEAEREAVVGAYRAWATRLHQEGRLLEADELAPEATVLTAAGVGSAPRRAGTAPSAGGYFLITARDLEEAVAVAGGCPALARGGSVEVVAIRRE
ncbi:MAG TPA: YciI family protein [Thermoanaerobaculia bacterium]|nr:YciI family protein [Thermoanaerobaculia bacterium]